MITHFKKITLAVALGASVLAVAAPAQAQSRGGYRGRDNGGAAVVAGIAGLAVGAALASSADRPYGGYYDGYDAPVAYPPVYNGYYAYPGYDYRGYNGYYNHGRGYEHDRGYHGRDHRGDGHRR